MIVALLVIILAVITAPYLLMIVVIAWVGEHWETALFIVSLALILVSRPWHASRPMPNPFRPQTPVDPYK